MNNDDRGQSRKWLPFLCIWYDLTFGNSIVTHQGGLAVMFDYYDTLITPEEVADMLNCGMNTTYNF